ncbi:MAG: UbiD family decarboxylase [Candidatus Tectomicrobia bacterium]|nr:UbiD family decarboxylase [Candidatus Tectomicrobia bacterium]
MKDVRDFIDEVAALKQLKTIGADVDWDEELGAITYLVAKRKPSPSLLFERIKDAPSGYRVLTNIMGSSHDRIALALRLKLGLPLMQMVEQVKDAFHRRIPPVEVPAATAPVNENVFTGDAVDVTKFPAWKAWPLDGGRYIGTACVTVTRDPDTGRVNLGTYRQMVQGKREINVYMSPGKDALQFMDRYWKRGEPMPIAVAYGIDPALLIGGAITFPNNAPEYECTGGMIGAPIEVFTGDVTGLPIPARAEIVVEGFFQPNTFRREGPMGEFQAYYGRPGGATPFIDVKCLRHRNNPILTCALMADYPACESHDFLAIVRSAKIWNDLDTLGIPGIKGVYSVPAAGAGMGMVIVSLEQRYAGHVAQTLALAAQCPAAAYFTKWFIAVDEDVDPTNLDEVTWAMVTRCIPTDGIDILRQTWSTYLDPSRNPPALRPYGSKVLVNACKEHRFLKTYSKRLLLREETYEQVSERWSALGLEGKPPVINHFETFEGGEPGPDGARRDDMPDPSSFQM